jgi:head-tail adaptor
MPPPTYIEAGKLRQRVTIIDPTQAPSGQDSFGGIILTTGVLIAENIPAAIEFVSAKLQYVGMFTSQVTHRVTIRWMPGIKAQMEIIFTDAEGRERKLQIMFIDNPDERKHMLILSCLERDQSVLVAIG